MGLSIIMRVLLKDHHDNIVPNFLPVDSWTCNFENGWAGCGMIQDNGDNFDWSVQSGTTPTWYTGPDRARDGYNYLYIEAGPQPKRSNGDYAT